MDDVGMNLFQRRETEIGSAENGLKFAAIGEDAFAGVPFHEAEVEDTFGFERTCTAGAGAEAVDEPGKLAKRGEFEDLEALGFAEAPGRRDGRARGFHGFAGAQYAAGIGASGGRFPS